MARARCRRIVTPSGATGTSATPSPPTRGGMAVAGVWLQQRAAWLN
ncbi:hypothetical protein XOCgx_0749 [Xanthomonas oryzae pv. oryzicola]|nr:hypothetical protein XOCgx_0749 [Xanthomonas oryzae pv. oryzicola]